MQNFDFDKVAQNPLFNLGVGLLSARGRPEGLLTGVQQYNRSRAMAAELERRRAEQEALQMENERRQAQLQAQQQLPGLMSMSPAGQPDPNIPQLSPPGEAYQMDYGKRDMLETIAQAYPDTFQGMVQQQISPPQQKMTELGRKLVEAGYQPGTPAFQEKMGQYLFKPTAPTVNIDMGPKLPGGFQWKDPGDPSAGVTPIKGGPKEQGTQGQNVAANYANRMVTSEGRMEEMVNSGFEPGKLSDYMARGVPIVGNYLIDPNAQVYRQAQEDWVRAKLRKESGAVIADEEMAREIETYFPQPGDSPQNIAAKEQARRVAIESLIAETEGQFERKFGGSSAKPTAENDPLGIR